MCHARCGRGVPQVRSGRASRVRSGRGVPQVRSGRGASQKREVDSLCDEWL